MNDFANGFDELYRTTSVIAGFIVSRLADPTVPAPSNRASRSEP